MSLRGRDAGYMSRDMKATIAITAAMKRPNVIVSQETPKSWMDAARRAMNAARYAPYTITSTLAGSYPPWGRAIAGGEHGGCLYGLLLVDP